MAPRVHKRTILALLSFSPKIDSIRHQRWGRGEFCFKYKVGAIVATSLAAGRERSLQLEVSHTSDLLNT